MEIGYLVCGRARGGSGVAGASRHVGAVIAADAGERGDAVLDRCPQAATIPVTRFQDDGGTPRAGAGEEELAPADVERPLSDSGATGGNSARGGTGSSARRSAMGQRPFGGNDHEKGDLVPTGEIADDLLGRGWACGTLVREGTERLGELLRKTDDQWWGKLGQGSRREVGGDVLFGRHLRRG